MCDSHLVRCIILTDQQNCPYDELILENAYELGPIILLTTDLLTQTNIIQNNTFWETANCSGHYRLSRCVDCYKCLSSTRIKEHYCHEHHNLFIYPLLPGGTLSFLIEYDDIKLLQFKNLHLFSIQYTIEGEKGEKMFSIMATKVPYMLPSYFESYNVLLIWLYSLSHACYVTYTIQAISGENQQPLATFTGQPMDSNFMDKITKRSATIEEFGHYLILKESVYNECKQLWPGTIINVFIHNY
uniref:Uncharacterized protein n=2 Tax=Rhodnius prolixus TaxID=13249 RepID=T1HMT8_RHOPR